LVTLLSTFGEQDLRMSPKLSKILKRLSFILRMRLIDWRVSMSTEEDMIKHLDQVNQVVEEYLKGNDPTQISKQLTIPRQRVVAYIDEWKVSASNNAMIRARAKEALSGADAHYSKLISKSYEVIDEASMTNNLSAKTAAIKLVMDIESKRIDMLQKAGLLENKELADEMVEIEKRQEVLVGILRDIASSHPEVRDLIMRRLSDISKDNEVITVIADV
jgi:hypothetical protein